jgi:Fe-S-cluster containining protein
MTKIDCEKCDAKCCKHVAVEIDKPKDKKDFEDIKWFVAHKNVNVYVDEEGDWYIEFLTPCEYLDKNNRCTNREKRPEICREYSQDECTFHNDYSEKHTFKTMEDVEKYLEDNPIKIQSK